MGGISNGAVVAATLIGPLAAVLITLWYQTADRNYQRRFAVFSTMMRWRRRMLAVDFVGALNLVPVEFSKQRRVVKRYQELFQIFSDTGWNSDSPDVRRRLVEKAETKVAELLSEMAKVLRIKIDQLQILRGAYAPKGWADDEEVNREMRQHLVGLFKGERLLPVVVFQPEQSTGGADQSVSTKAEP